MANAGRVKRPRTTFNALRDMGVLSSTPLHVDTLPPPDIANVAMLEDAEEGTCAAEPLDESESSAKPCYWEPWENGDIDSDDESDDGEAAGDGADEDDLQFFSMNFLGFERIERTPPHLKQLGARCMQRSNCHSQLPGTNALSMHRVAASKPPFCTDGSQQPSPATSTPPHRPFPQPNLSKVHTPT